MTEIRLQLKVSTTDQRLWIRTELAGQVATVHSEAWTLRVAFPEWVGEGVVGANEAPYWGRMGGDAAAPIGLWCAWFTVEADADLELASEPALLNQLTPGYVAALGAAIRVLVAARVEQPWIGLIGSSPRVIEVRGKRLDTGVEIDGARALRLPGKIIATDTVFEPEQFSAALVEDGPRTELLLLAQARYFAHFAPDLQPGLAVLLAAIACEVAAKAVLEERASPEVRPLLDLLVKGRRLPGPAVDLFGSVALAVLGHSLREDDEALFRTLERLFQVRNGLAHRADSPTRQEAADLVRAALAAIEWLLHMEPTL